MYSVSVALSASVSAETRRGPDARVSRAKITRDLASGLILRSRSSFWYASARAWSEGAFASVVA